MDRSATGNGPVTGRPWSRVAWIPALTSIGFLALHVGGGAYALSTALRAFILQDAVRLLVALNVWFRVFAPVWFLLPLGLALLALLAGAEARRTLGRWRRREPEPDVGLRVRVLAYVLLACIFVNAFFLSTPETFAGPFRMRFPILGEMTAGFAYGVYVLWSRQLPRLRRVFPDRLRRTADVFGMNVALLLVLAEATLRLAAAFFPSPLLVTQSSTSLIRRDANREQPGTLRFGFPMNRGGHYDTEFVPRSSTLNRVVVGIGDSFSYGTVPHRYHFTTVAERALSGVDVYNMGYSAIGPTDYLNLLVHEALPLDPDLLVIHLFVGNDVTEGPSPAGPARWYDADSYLLAIVWHRLGIMRQAKLVDAAEATRLTNLTPEQMARFYPQLADPLMEKASVSDELFFAVAERNAGGICLPDEDLYPPFFETLTKITKAAKDVPVAFVVIPEEFQVEDDIWQELVRRNEQPLDRDLAQRTIVTWLKDRGLPVLDLLPLLRAVAPMQDGRRHVYHLRNLHFNARGNEIAGRAIAGFLDSLLSATSAPLSLPRHLVLGDGQHRRWMQAGWSHDETSGNRSYVWSDGPKSILNVPLPRQGDVRMDFEVNPFVFPGSPEQRVTTVLNGAVVGETALRPGLHQYSVRLPEGTLRNTSNALEFRYGYARAARDVLPDSPDLRTLAVAWYSIAFAAHRP